MTRISPSTYAYQSIHLRVSVRLYTRISPSITRISQSNSGDLLSVGAQHLFAAGGREGVEDGRG